MSFSVNFIWSAWSVIRSFKIWIRFGSFAKENKLASNPGMCQVQPQGAGPPGLGGGAGALQAWPCSRRFGGGNPAEASESRWRPNRLSRDRKRPWMYLGGAGVCLPLMGCGRPSLCASQVEKGAGRACLLLWQGGEGAGDPEARPLLRGTSPALEFVAFRTLPAAWG